MPKVSIENLTHIINTTSLLSDTEKQEWLKLLEFMNDKQLSDLYTVLSEGSEVVPIAPPSPPSIPQSPQGAPLQAFLAKNVRPQPVPPSLKSGDNRVQAPRQTEWNRSFQQAMSEKELPAGESHALLTPAHTVSTIANNRLQGGSTNEKFDSRGGEILRRSVLLPPQDDRKGRISMSALLDATARNEQLGTGTVGVVKSKSTVAPEKPREPEQVPIATIADVGRIPVSMLTLIGVNGLALKLRHVMETSSYFEVLFYLEKSPLYAAYVATGHAILTKGASFDKLQTTPDDRITRYLTKEEFEQVADLLRQIKAT